MKLLSTTLALSLTATTLAAPTPIRTIISTRQIACEEVQETPNGSWSVVCPVKREPAVCDEVQETPGGPWSVVCQPSPPTKRSATAFDSRQIACEEIQETPNGPWSVVCPVSKRSPTPEASSNDNTKPGSNEPAVEQQNIAAGFAPPNDIDTGEKRSPAPHASVDDNTAPGFDEPAVEQENIAAGFAPPKDTQTGEKRDVIGAPIPLAADPNCYEVTPCLNCTLIVVCLEYVGSSIEVVNAVPGSNEPAIESENIASGFAPPNDTNTGEKRSPATTDLWLSGACFQVKTCDTCEEFTICPDNSGPPTEQQNSPGSFDEPQIEQDNISAGFAPPKNTTTGEDNNNNHTTISHDIVASKPPYDNCTSHSTNTTSSPTSITASAQQASDTPGSDEPAIEQGNIASGFGPPADTPTGEDHKDYANPAYNVSSSTPPYKNCTEHATSPSSLSTATAVYTKRGLPIEVTSTLGPVPTAWLTTE